MSGRALLRLGLLHVAAALALLAVLMTLGACVVQGFTLHHRVHVDPTTWECDVETITEDRLDDPRTDAAERCHLTGAALYDVDRCYVYRAQREARDDDTRYSYSVSCLAGSDDPELSSCLRGALELRNRLNEIGAERDACLRGLSSCREVAR